MSAVDAFKPPETPEGAIETNLDYFGQDEQIGNAAFGQLKKIDSLLSQMDQMAGKSLGKTEHKIFNHLVERLLEQRVGKLKVDTDDFTEAYENSNWEKRGELLGELYSDLNTFVQNEVQKIIDQVDSASLFDIDSLAEIRKVSKKINPNITPRQIEEIQQAALPEKYANWINRMDSSMKFAKQVVGGTGAFARSRKKVSNRIKTIEEEINLK